MIVVRVELHSAVTKRVTELARMIIANDGTGGDVRRNYGVMSLRGRGKAQLDKMIVQKRGRVEYWPSKSLHVWNLVARALRNLDYDIKQ